MKAKIYTKTGDKGQTSLVGGTRVAKTDLRLEAYGTLDELNSVLGMLRGSTALADDFGKSINASLQVIQNNLFNIGSHLACEDAKIAASLPSLSAGATSALENDMDAWERELPPLKNFILPGGHELAALAHLVRTVCRRAERATIRMREAGADVSDEYVVYLNRLSDWAFLLARKFNHHFKVADIPWEKG